MSVETRLIEYQESKKTYRGLLARETQAEGPLPLVLVSHTIRGRTEFEDGKAERLAAQGHAALSLDLYGIETRGADIDAMRGHMNALLADRAALQARLLGWLACARQQPEVDAARVAAIGFCFGGLCVLDLARTGADVLAVASFHGLFDPPDNTAGNRIAAKVLAMHGWDDPLAPPDKVLALADELTAAGADWQIHAYGNTMHAFTNPAAADTAAGTVYDANADRRSWSTLTTFLNEIF